MRLVLTLVASAAVLAACGGGGDSGNSNNAGGNSSNSIAPAVVLTKDNYVEVAQEGLTSQAFLLKNSSLPMGGANNQTERLAQIGQDFLPSAQTRFGKASSMAVKSVQSESMPCDGGGSMTITANDRNGNQLLDSGDALTFTANQCRENGVLLSGSLVITVQRLQGNLDSYPYALDATVSYQQLTASSGQEQIVGNGDVTLSVDARNYNIQNLSLKTSQFSAAYRRGTQSFTQTLQNYEASLKETSSTDTTAVNGTVTSTGFGTQSVKVQTLTPFVRSSGAYPSSGQALFTGANKATVRATALDSTRVKIELDADGDGVYELNTTKLWREL